MTDFGSFQGTVDQDIRDSTPDWAAYRAPTAPDDAPNVLYVLWDDVGVAAWDCFGGLIDTPNIRRVADRGLKMSQFHTTALCSPTRASLLTGRNATSVGMASVENMVQGYPGQHGRIPASTAMISEVLGERGWSTYAVGKWHLAPIEDCHAAGSRRHWPLGRGFDRFYGFLDGMTDQWYPSLVSDNRPIDPPATPEQGYHLSKDLADNAIGFLRDHRASAPDKPWFMYFCPGAGHSPHQVAPEWADAYRGRFDMGYEEYRRIALANQKALGLLPDDTELSPINPYADATSADGLPWPGLDTVLPWDSLSENQKRVSIRMAEVFAGFLTYTDAQLGRVLDHLEATGQLDNTLVVIASDNGASGEGGPSGEVQHWAAMSGDDGSAAAMTMLDEIGGPATEVNYSTGWAMAFNTPHKLYKRYASQEGGIADPCVISWPAGLPARGEVRDRYVHVSDITPTVYDLLNIAPPETVRGIAQDPLEGISFRAALLDADADTGKVAQFYSMMGTRGVWYDGWFAGTVHPATSSAPRGWSNFGRDRWELFHIDVDRSQLHDLAADHPEKLAALQALWEELAQRYRAYPLNDLSALEIVMSGAAAIGPPPKTVVYYPDTPALHTPLGGLGRGRTFRMYASVTVDDPAATGVLYSQGKRAGGQVLYLEDGVLHYVCSHGGEQQRLRAESATPPGVHALGVTFTHTGRIENSMDVDGDVEMFIDDESVGTLVGVRMTALDSMQTVTAGRSVTYAVSSDFASPHPLVGATLDRVTIEFQGDGGADGDAGATVDRVFARD